ncbi:MAG: ASKHA domain-containing protein, partial [Anaerovoracaceae bacterium]
DMARLPEDFLPDRKTRQPGEQEAHYGLAVDIGTTTVVGMLWDLRKAEPVGAVARTNPQSDYGADVISRIMYCGTEDGNLQRMQEKIIGCLNAIIQEFSDSYAIDPQTIREIVAVGNTTMSHLLLAIDPKSLALAPFSPGFTGPVSVKAKELGLAVHEEATVNVLPNIAGHVGSDIVAVLLSSGLEEMEGANLAIDIGTNGEILLACSGNVLTCSTAAGPAFEGASIQQGMRAATGAIEGVRIHDGELDISVIGDAEPVGICGSGLIDGVAELLKSGLVNKKGKLLTKADAQVAGLPDSLSGRLEAGEFGNSFILCTKNDGSKIFITQKDIREVQLAKGAILAGIRIMMQELHLKDQDLDQVFLAGAFGNYIRVESALAIGLLPEVKPDRVISIGNAAGAGACMALLSKETLEKANRLAREVNHIDLAEHPDFQTVYLQAMYF